MSNTATMMGLGASPTPLKISDAFSTTLYTGNATADTKITTGINLKEEGGLLWTKKRSAAADHYLWDSINAFDGGTSTTYSSKRLKSNAADLKGTEANALMSFETDGFVASTNGAINGNGSTYASWSFRKAPKFFDVVSWIGDSTSGRKISHSLDSEVGTIFVKSTTENYQWVVYSKNYGGGYYSWFPTAHKFYTSASNWDNTDATSTEFTLGNNGNVNLNTAGYVAYVFAESDLMKTGLIVGDGTSAREISLGFTPQWLVFVRVDVESSTWLMYDSKRGINAGAADPYLRMTATNLEESDQQYVETTADGFKVGLASSGSYFNVSGQTYMYMAIKAE
tara:strand:- start:392 stop:1405 length:1014 start_codon:yes stop_codon:yes gene_type:complete